MPGQRIREARLRAGLTQRQLAGDRYTASYISALEKGLTRASMASLQFLSGRLGVSQDYFIRDERPRWERMHADLLLASEQWTEAVDAYTSLLDGDLSPVERALVLRGRAEAYSRIGRPGDALADASPAYLALVAAGRKDDAAYAAYWLAYAQYRLDNLDESRALILQVLSEVRAGLSVQEDFRLRLLVALANIEGARGRHAQALAYLEEGRALADALDDRRRATFLFSMALGYSGSGDHEAALHNGSEALALYQAASAASEVASLRNTMAVTHLQLGSLTKARAFAGQALREADRLGDQPLRSHVLDTQARIALAGEDTGQAIRLSSDAIETARSVGYLRGEADGLLTRARAHHRAGDRSAAEADFGSATALLRSEGSGSRLRSVLRDWAALMVEQGRHAEAVTLLTEAASE
jgi:transcriptional regulator with XRE-family HTH domain